MAALVHPAGTIGEGDPSPPSPRVASFAVNLLPHGFGIDARTQDNREPPSYMEIKSSRLHPYDRSSDHFLRCLDNGVIPGEQLDSIPCVYRDGEVVCEIRDYRRLPEACKRETRKWHASISSEEEAAGLQGADGPRPGAGTSSEPCVVYGCSPEVHFVTLRPTTESVVKDVAGMADVSWTYHDMLEVESRILAASQPDVCLDPDPMVAVKANAASWQRFLCNAVPPGSFHSSLLAYRRLSSLWHRRHQALLLASHKQTRMFRIGLEGEEEEEEDEEEEEEDEEEESEDMGLRPEAIPIEGDDGGWDMYDEDEDDEEEQGRGVVRLREAGMGVPHTGSFEHPEAHAKRQRMGLSEGLFSGSMQGAQGALPGMLPSPSSGPSASDVHPASLSTGASAAAAPGVPSADAGTAAALAAAPAPMLGRKAQRELEARQRAEAKRQRQEAAKREKEREKQLRIQQRQEEKERKERLKKERAEALLQAKQAKLAAMQGSLPPLQNSLSQGGSQVTADAPSVPGTPMSTSNAAGLPDSPVASSPHLGAAAASPSLHSPSMGASASPRVGVPPGGPELLSRALGDGVKAEDVEGTGVGGDLGGDLGDVPWSPATGVKDEAPISLIAQRMQLQQRMRQQQDLLKRKQNESHMPPPSAVPSADGAQGAVTQYGAALFPGMQQQQSQAQLDSQHLPQIDPALGESFSGGPDFFSWDHPSTSSLPGPHASGGLPHLQPPSPLSSRSGTMVAHPSDLSKPGSVAPQQIMAHGEHAAGGAQHPGMPSGPTAPLNQHLRTGQLFPASGRSGVPALLRLIQKHRLSVQKWEPSDEFTPSVPQHVRANPGLVGDALASKAEDPMPHKGRRTLLHCPFPGSSASTANVNTPRMRGLTLVMHSQATQAPGQPQVRRHLQRLVLRGRHKDEMVEVLVQEGADGDQGGGGAGGDGNAAGGAGSGGASKRDNQLPLMPNMDYADRFVSAYIKVVVKEGWQLVDDQVIPLPVHSQPVTQISTNSAGPHNRMQPTAPAPGGSAVPPAHPHTRPPSSGAPPGPHPQHMPGHVSGAAGMSQAQGTVAGHMHGMAQASQVGLPQSLPQPMAAGQGLPPRGMPHRPGVSAMGTPGGLPTRPGMPHQGLPHQGLPHQGIPQGMPQGLPASVGRTAGVPGIMHQVGPGVHPVGPMQTGVAQGLARGQIQGMPGAYQPQLGGAQGVGALAGQGMRGQPGGLPQVYSGAVGGMPPVSMGARGHAVGGPRGFMQRPVQQQMGQQMPGQQAFPGGQQGMPSQAQGMPGQQPGMASQHQSASGQQQVMPGQQAQGQMRPGMNMVQQQQQHQAGVGSPAPALNAPSPPRGMAPGQGQQAQQQSFQQQQQQAQQQSQHAAQMQQQQQAQAAMQGSPAVAKSPAMLKRTLISSTAPSPLPQQQNQQQFRQQQGQQQQNSQQQQQQQQGQQGGSQPSQQQQHQDAQMQQQQQQLEQQSPQQQQLQRQQQIQQQQQKVMQQQQVQQAMQRQASMQQQQQLSQQQFQPQQPQNLQQLQQQQRRQQMILQQQQQQRQQQMQQQMQTQQQNQQNVQQQQQLQQQIMQQQQQQRQQQLQQQQQQLQQQLQRQPTSQGQGPPQAGQGQGQPGQAMQGQVGQQQQSPAQVQAPGQARLQPSTQGQGPGTPGMPAASPAKGSASPAPRPPTAGVAVPASPGMQRGVAGVQGMRAVIPGQGTPGSAAVARPAVPGSSPGSTMKGGGPGGMQGAKGVGPHVGMPAPPGASGRGNTQNG